MRPSLAALTLALLTFLPLLAGGSARAAGPYDGQWAGKARSTGNTPGHFCPTEGAVTMTVEDNGVSGQIVFLAGAPVIRGRVGGNGILAGTAGSAALAGKFSRGAFEGSYTNPGGCPISLSLTRAK
jgi:hypothetical protein